MTNASVLLRRLDESPWSEPVWVTDAADRLDSNFATGAAIVRAQARWCYQAYDAANGDAWELLILGVQAWLVEHRPDRTSRSDAQYVISALARRMRDRGVITV